MYVDTAACSALHCYAIPARLDDRETLGNKRPTNQIILCTCKKNPPLQVQSHPLLPCPSIMSTNQPSIRFTRMMPCPIVITAITAIPYNKVRKSGSSHLPSAQRADDSVYTLD